MTASAVLCRRPRGTAGVALAAMLLAIVSGTAAEAEKRLSAKEFEAYVTGRTLLYAGPGEQAYGAEKYLADRRVIWTFLDGECVDGFWYEKSDGLICFVYEAAVAPQCWSFWSSKDGLSAQFENDPGAVTLFELDQSEEPLTCQGPEVGV